MRRPVARTGRFAFRIDQEALDTFETKCREMRRNPADMIRELVDEFNSGKLIITRKNPSEGLYDRE